MKMNILAKLALCCLALQAGEAGQKAFAQAAALKTEQEKTGYAMGVNMGNYIKGIGVDMDTDALVKGLKDTVAGNPLLLTSTEMSTILQALTAKVQEKQAAKRKEQEAMFKEESAKDNLKEGADFMAKNKTAPGVTALTNGLQYSVIKAGTGPIPKPTDTVKVNYRGTFLDGKEFDASPTNKPFPCSLAGGVIDGWTDILKLMPTGSKWKVFIPPDLAYHAQGMPGAIPPNATLVFEMELVSIDPAK
jgi:FKBP-type peptidyl-prolyl cis-trans isomerase